MSFTYLDNAGDTRIALYFVTSENALFRINEPNPGVFIAESPKVIERALDAGYKAESILVNEELIHQEGKDLIEKIWSRGKEQFPIYVLSDAEFKKIKGFNMTGGMMALMERKRNFDSFEAIKECKRIAVLEDVENPTNVGAIFRCAAALGMDAVLITKDSADPLYRRALRVSMGTVFSIPWAYIEKDYIGKIKQAGFKTVAMALKDDSLSLEDKCLKEEAKLAVLMGNEGNGLKDDTISRSDYTVMIPMEHGVDSLNVAGAASIAFWELGRRK
ncbi:MAG: RNA methyltransferase [Lachnospiraceae bacterium]|nr:RNA methyltransferase [Lachnospiraceae bacterium]